MTKQELIDMYLDVNQYAFDDLVLKDIKEMLVEYWENNDVRYMRVNLQDVGQAIIDRALLREEYEFCSMVQKKMNKLA